MKRLSRKALQAEGQKLDGIKLNCNPYTFDNAIHYISQLENVPAGSYLCGAEENENRINDIINQIKKDFPESKGCSYEYLYYSAGVYGNNGQLYKVFVLDADYNRTENSFYIYF